MNIEQIRDYVYNDKPIAGTVAKDWLRYVLEESEKANDKLVDAHSKLALVEEDLFYEKRSNEENHAKYVAAYHELEQVKKERDAYREVLEGFAHSKFKSAREVLDQYRSDTKKGEMIDDSPSHIRK